MHKLTYCLFSSAKIRHFGKQNNIITFFLTFFFYNISICKLTTSISLQKETIITIFAYNLKVKQKSLNSHRIKA